MADRYWVGGTGTWSSTNTANWAATSGGAGGETVPTASDNVFFDAGSDSGGTFVVTMANNPRVCNDITVSGLDFAMTLAGPSIGLVVSGSLTFPATNFTRTYNNFSTGTTFNATTPGKTITTNGVSLDLVRFDGVGGEWTLGSNFTCVDAVLVNGSLDTSVNNYAFNASTFSTSGNNAKSLNLRGSTVTLTDGFNGWAVSPTNFSFDAGTSTIVLAGEGVTSTRFYGGGFTYHNFVFEMNRAGGVILDFRLDSISTPGLGATFNDVTFNTVPVNRAPNKLWLSANITINGTFTCNGQDGLYRFLIRGFRGPATMTCATIASMTDVDFEYITIAGTAAPLSGTRLGNGGGNSGITFDPGVNKYWNNSVGGNLRTDSWALTSGGAVSPTNYPLPQDTAIIENTGLDSGATIQTNLAGETTIGNLDMSSRTDPMTFSIAGLGAEFTIFGNLTLGSGVTMTGTNTINYATGSTTKTLDTAGKTFTQPFSIRGSGGVQLINNNLTTSSATDLAILGTIDLNGLTWTTTTFNTGFISFAASMTFNGGNLVLTGSGSSVWRNSTLLTNFTTIAGTGPGTITMTSASAKTFEGGGATYAASLIQGGAGTLTITGSNTFEDITNSTQPSTILFTGGTTQTVDDFTLSGTSGNLITIDSTTASPFTLSKSSGNVSVSFLDIQDSAATGGASWIALDANGNVDSGNNTGWIFSSGGTGNMLMMFF